MSAAEAEALGIAFILPLPSVITFFRSSSLAAWTSGDFRSRISTFIILAMAGFGAPSAPWQDLQDLSYAAFPAVASAAVAAIAVAAAKPRTNKIVRILMNLLALRKCSH